MPFDELDTWLQTRADADEFSGVVLIRRAAAELLTHTSGLADDADEAAGEDYEACGRQAGLFGHLDTRLPAAVR